MPSEGFPQVNDLNGPPSSASPCEIAAQPTHPVDPVPAFAPASQHVPELLAAWESACATSYYGGQSVVFRDPIKIVSDIAGLVDDPSSPSTQEAARNALAAARHNDVNPAIAVQQLCALGSVVHGWLESHPGLDPRRGLLTGRGADLDATLAEVVADALGDLEQATLVDPLTGLWNRRALDRDLLQCLAAIRRRDQCLTVVMIDVEGLKSTNDQFGHAAGDDVLRAVAAGLVASLRTVDNAYRIGGDEFVLVLPGLRPEHIDAVMARLVVHGRVAFTWGCAWVRDDDRASDAERAAQLLGLADRRMLGYRARLRASSASLPNAPSPSSSESPSAEELAGRFSAGSRAGIVIDEARGYVAEHFGLSIDEASITLHAFAVRLKQPVLAVAADIMDGTLDPDQLTIDRPEPDRSGRHDSDRTVGD